MPRRALGLVLGLGSMLLSLGGGLPEAEAQNIKATLDGLVLDPQRQRVPGAEIEATEIDRGLRRSTLSDSAGLFHVAGLEAGRWVVQVRLSGFASYRSSPIDLEIGDAVTLNVQLTLPDAGTAIVVSAKRLQLHDSKQSESFSDREMNDLPVQATGQGRSFYAQARTAPGVAFSTLAHRPFAVSGQRPRNNNYMVDSVEMNDADSGFIAGRGFTEQLVSQETVQSFEMMTHTYKAEYGRNSGSVVSLVTKSGTNQLHGSLYHFHNNSALRARSPLEAQKRSSRSNLFGFTVGGPVRRDKIHLFGNLEFFRPRGTSLATFRTLTDEERRRAVPSVQPLAALYPHSPDGSRAFATGVPDTVDGVTFLARGDLVLTPQQKLMLRTNYTRGITDRTAIGNTVASDFLIRNQTGSVAAHHSWAVTPLLLNEFRFGYLRLIQRDSNFDAPILLGDPAVNGQIGFMIVPGLSLAGPLPFSGRNQAQNNFQFSNDLSWSRGSHLLKMGSSLRQVEVNGGSLNNSFVGSIFFPNINAFLAGQPLSYSRNIGNPLIGLGRREWHAYVQDDWRVTPYLTLNLGLRYELNTAPSEVDDLIPEEFRFRGDHNNFAPRIGLAWSMTPRTVLRAGYGIYYNAIEMAFMGMTRFNPPLVESFSVFRPTFPDLLEGARQDLASGLVVPDQGTRTPYAQHFMIALERELWNPQSSLSVSYVGTTGRKLSRNRRPNGGENLPQDQRPDPGLGVVNRLESSAFSNYHALQTSFQYRTGGSLHLRTAYTYSRFIDDGSEIPTTNLNLEPTLIPLDEEKLFLDKAVSDFDIPHIFTLTALYPLPFFRNSSWLGDWTGSVLTTLQSGRPYSLFSGTDNLTGSNNNRINDVGGALIRSPSSAAAVRLAEGFRVADLIPPAGTLGSLGRNSERGDSYLNCNVSLAKQFPVSERVRIDLRAEIFNLFNTTNLDEVDNVVASPSFGRVLTSLEPRTVQVALRVVF